MTSNRFFPLTITLILAAVLAFIIKDFIAGVIVKPLLYVFWFIVFTIESFPQWLIWGGFILGALVVAFRSLRKESASRKGSARPARLEGPVVTWLVLVERAQLRPFPRWFLARALRKLADQIASTEGRSHPRGEEPAEIQAYLNAPSPRFEPFYKFWHHFRFRRHATALDLDPEVVVGYLENTLDPLAGE